MQKPVSPELAELLDKWFPDVPNALLGYSTETSIQMFARTILAGITPGQVEDALAEARQAGKSVTKVTEAMHWSTLSRSVFSLLMTGNPGSAKEQVRGVINDADWTVLMQESDGMLLEAESIVIIAEACQRVFLLVELLEGVNQYWAKNIVAHARNAFQRRLVFIEWLDEVKQE